VANCFLTPTAHATFSTPFSASADGSASNRAPIIARTGPEVDILASSDGKPVLVRQGRILVATFHPELTADTTVHEYFLRMLSQPIGNHAKLANHPASPSALSVEGH